MSLHDPGLISFASDNYAGAHPDVLAAVAAANGGHTVSYGGDPYTARLEEICAELFGAAVEVYPVLTGGGANVIALQSVTDRYASVVCPDTAHINCDECAAPEAVGGLKLSPVSTGDGKLTPDQVEAACVRLGDEHAAQPQVVSITQVTELGTVYTVDEIAAICRAAHARDLVVHVDGARLANAVASLSASLREQLTDTGVDIVSFGGTKNGALGAEAVVVLNPDATLGMNYVRKQLMQLGSKLRFVSAQLVALLTDDLYVRNAAHANAMATRLAGAIDGLPGLTITQPVQSNAVFAILPRAAALELQRRYRFYFWDEHTGEVRWMCAFDTPEAAVNEFADAIRVALSS